MSNPEFEFGVPGTFDPTEFWERNERTLHQGGLDNIGLAADQITALTGAIGYDPQDLLEPSLDSELTVEKKDMPQWGPPFVAFVYERLTGLEKKVNEAILKWSFQPQTAVFNVGLQTDAGGNVGVAPGTGIVWQSPPGFTLALHRFTVLIFDGAHNFGAPASNAGSYYEIRVDNEAVDGGSLVAPNGLPVVRTWGTRDAPRIRDGESLSLFISGIQATTRLVVKGQGTMDRTIEG